MVPALPELSEAEIRGVRPRQRGADCATGALGLTCWRGLSALGMAGACNVRTWLHGDLAGAGGVLPSGHYGLGQPVLQKIRLNSSHCVKCRGRVPHSLPHRPQPVPGKCQGSVRS